MSETEGSPGDRSSQGDRASGGGTAWMAREPVPFPPPFASSWGDDEYGLFADLTLDSGDGEVTQRLRWIEPGSFRMGSPETEVDRYSNEGPRHVVRLSRGFWLGDTACTQELWRAVTGTAPSAFKGEARPVENVSFEDVEGFLGRLRAAVPGVVADLPTEAEWEYACRAGTESAFSLGEQIRPQEVNYDGNYPYADGPKGLYREETVEVKSLPANAWGLYEMHGNVDEWCRDGMRKYVAEEVTDPVGATGVAGDRAVRGGSWFDYARHARSASRLARLPGYRFSNQGFRLCLRSMSGDRAEPDPQGLSGGRARAGDRREP